MSCGDTAPNLKKQLVRNRMYDRLCTTPNCVICPYGRAGDCMASGVICLITCQSCEVSYIGETGRPLRVRVKEHLDGLTKSKSSTSLGTHCRQANGDVEFQVSVTILAHEPDIIARKTLEAFWIAGKNPKLKRKDECIAITNELSPYQDL